MLIVGCLEDPPGVRVQTARASIAGLLVLAERLRDGTRDTISYLLDQGITIKVLSGDAPATVAAVAAAAGIRPRRGARTPPTSGMTRLGRALPGGRQPAGRVRPAQKLAAVRALQRPATWWP